MHSIIVAIRIGAVAFLLILLILLASVSVPEAIEIGSIQPLPASQRDNGLFSVGFKTRGQRKAKTALLYTYASTNMPEALQKLEESMLEPESIGKQIGLFEKTYGVVRGSVVFDGMIPDHEIISLPPRSTPTRRIGVRVALYRFLDQKWVPLEDQQGRVLMKRQTITVD